MTIEYNEVPRRKSSVSFSVSTVGMQITLEPARFTFFNRALSVSEQTYSVAGHAIYDTHVYLYIVVAEADGSVSMAVDEVVEDGIDRPLVSWGGTGYKMLFPFGYFVLPAGTSSLDDVVIPITRYTFQPEPVEDEEET